MRIANHHVPQITAFLLCVEFLEAFASTYLGAMLRFLDSNYHYSPHREFFFISGIAFAVATAFSMSAFGLYRISYRKGIRNTLLRLIPSFALSFSLITLLFYLLPDLYIGRGILGLVVLIAASMIIGTRALIFKFSEVGLLKSRIAFLGCGKLANECRTLALNNTSYHHYELVGFIPTEGEECLVPVNELLTNNSDLTTVLKQHNVHEIVVSVMNRRGVQFPLQELLDCKLHGIKVIESTAFIEREACQIRVESLHPGWLIFGEGFNQSFLRKFGKQTFDLIISALIFVITSPIMLLTSIFIYLEDRGPIFFRQERVGKNNSTYMVLKFRSMRSDAEKNGVPQWACNNDPRVTRVGNIIRKLRIDELPQIINVLYGDMSFVGPRPERPYFVDQLCTEVPFYNLRHSIKPGITGMAQVRYAYGASVEDSLQKLQYDLYYVKNNSLFLDALILIDTVQVVLFGKGR
ncbi:TIGR03013 family XrtA/PEP-CTERM system glycosyltransferase [Solimicrobium silvestre]|uniref:Sugar transferase, PEP-CTERM system associated n=1 Tax=Solimicrobium silvestre TaxID=2099400 RepID=A0A2S9GTA8_9BURK|nr:TIGR03013 family XrtA/PEP-CTERM system glycosyltransferase [Solimicrobium silvestre]PRC90950.1 Sugar transferase, PEP-CTERM system associated [Solimicrobium silvestre]